MFRNNITEGDGQLLDGATINEWLMPAIDEHCMTSCKRSRSNI